MTDDALGKLISLGKGTYGTTNAVNVKYLWPKGASGETYNVVLFNTSFIFEQSSRRMYTHLSPMNHCEISSGFCEDGKFVFVWAFDPKFLCPTISKTVSGKDTHLANIHYLESGNISFIELPDMAMSFHRMVICTSYIKGCFTGSQILCLPNGFVLGIKSCNSSNVLDFFRMKAMSSESD